VRPMKFCCQYGVWVLRVGRCGIGILSLLLCLLSVHAQDEYEYTLLDDFEDVSAWIKGDPTTDMQQREVGYAPSSKFVKEGKQSLAFMIRVDWTEKPGQQYAKGWPMVFRKFDKPQDWSSHDRVEFWVYTETQATLPSPALRCGFGSPGGKPEKWHDLALVPNQWTHVSLSLGGNQDWTEVTGVWFYVAEAWYRDGDRVNFYFDDMRLATRRRPAFSEATVTARTQLRGRAAEVRVCIEGPPGNVILRSTVTAGDVAEATHETALQQKRCTLSIPLNGVSAGGHTMLLELLSPDGKVADRAARYFRTLQAGKRPYLCLITFYTPHIMAATAEQMAVINDTPYDGVAMPIAGAYDTQPVPDYETYGDQIAMLRRTCRYRIWPWVFVNRFIGCSAESRRHTSQSSEPPEYFRRIKSLDLDDAAGARSDMMKIWQHAVRMARDLGSPGIVLDLEAYNDYRTYDVAHVAEERGETVAQVARACEEVGADLARIVQQEYPQCVVWSLFSRLQPTDIKAQDYEGPIYPVPGHITHGFLAYCQRNRVPAKYLCGGEVELGYYNRNVSALKDRIRARDAAFEAPLRQFPDHFFLAGTISPYHDYKILTGWLKKAAGEDPELKNIHDFLPMFKALFDAYDWVWIYASTAGQTAPYDPETSKLYSGVLDEALKQAME
jgi:hypothetical protein